MYYYTCIRALQKILIEGSSYTVSPFQCMKKKSLIKQNFRGRGKKETYVIFLTYNIL